MFSKCSASCDARHTPTEQISSVQDVAFRYAMTDISQKVNIEMSFRSGTSETTNFTDWVLTDAGEIFLYPSAQVNE